MASIQNPETDYVGKFSKLGSFLGSFLYIRVP